MQRTAIKLGEKMKLTVVYPFSMKFHVVSFEDEGKKRKKVPICKTHAQKHCFFN